MELEKLGIRKYKINRGILGKHVQHVRALRFRCPHDNDRPRASEVQLLSDQS